jgi:glycosyltransferase involved in cell wall biosynthesis
VPLFSIVIPAEGHGDRLIPAVGSVLCQTFRDLEVVVVDHGEAYSLDHLASIADPRVRFVRSDRTGVSAARNAGVRQSTGEHVAFLEDGDMALPRWLETLVSLVDQEDRSVARCGVLRLGPGGLIEDVVFPRSMDSPKGWSRRFLAGSYSLPRKMLEAVGGFAEPDSPAPDHAGLALRLIRQRPALGWVEVSSPSPLVRRRFRKGSLAGRLDPLIDRPAARSGPPTMASVIIPAYNARETLDEQLEALAEQTYRGPWEVIVVDDASTDGTGEAARRWADRIPIRVIAVSTNRGAAHAWNVGAAAAKGDFLAYCDADDRVAPRWLEALAESARDHDLVGGSMETEYFNPPEIREGRGLPVTTGQPVGEGFPPKLRHGGNLGVWREVVAWLGGWREDYRAGGEDLEFPWRAQLAGYRLGFAPEAVIHYRLRSDIRGFARQMFTYTKSYVRLYKEYRPAGLRHRPWREIVGGWIWIVVHAPDVVRGPARRLRWIRVAARNAGLLTGSLQHRILYP